MYFPSFFFFFHWKPAFWYTPNLFFACWRTWDFRAENTFGVYFFPSNDWSLFRAYRGLFGADRTGSSAPHSRGEAAEIPPKGPFWAQLAPFGLSPRLDFPNSRKRAEYCFESTVSEKRTHWASLSFTAHLVSCAKHSVSLFWLTENRLRGTHWVLSPELGEGQKTHWVRDLKPYSPKPYSAHFRVSRKTRKKNRN